MPTEAEARNVEAFSDSESEWPVGVPGLLLTMCSISLGITGLSKRAVVRVLSVNWVQNDVTGANCRYKLPTILLYFVRLLS